ncbi:TonB-dependent receptor [Halieaceae bacterium IMCC14734]|uniref:TonB-dependent receptor n=1 Tax=Candidatus Litorirhabdus singularis TaxID=2518993 RepID=A0ABT3TE42_9GAMM|nr:TonB-dependent receptor [Candidatus Litorirhabdus singularis]MCX2980269.1 TonB-dependent receptor [Candidatus Litorirhabdus singularis]
MKHKFQKTLLAASLACMSVITVQAQMLEEVIVTAQKREQNLQDVPVAVSAFNNEMLEQTGVRDMFELQANAPSLRVGQTQSSSTATFGIRGVFTSSQNFGLESSVGLYVDGVYRARQSSMINNLVDIGSVEVLRGPQGTLFGRNTPAGAVSVNSVKPDHDGSAYLQVEGGDYNLFSAQGAVSISAIEDVLAFRLTGFGMQRDGFVSDVALGDDKIYDRDRWGGRLQALWTPNDDLSIHVIADMSEIDEVCCGNGTLKNNFEADDVPGKLGTDTNVRDNIGGTVLLGEDFYDYDVAYSYLPVSTNEDKGLTAQIDWQADNFLLTSITAYREYESFDDVDSDFMDIDALKRTNEQSQKQFSQELRISQEFDRFNYVAGLYYFSQELDTYRETIVGVDTAALVGLAALPNSFIGGDGSYDTAEQEHTSYAAFGQVDFSITDALVLTAGLRWTKEDKDMSNTFVDDAPPALDPTQDNWGFYLFPPLAPRDDADEEIDDDEVTGSIKLSWFATDTIMLYGSYGTGYKAGGTNTDRIEEIIPTVFGPETSESYEIGMKAEFPDQAVRLNVALHRTDTEDLQTVSFQGTAFALQNAGMVEAQGLEVDLFWQATDSLGFTVAYAYNDAEYADFEKGDCQIATPWHTGEADPGDNGDGSCDRSGGMVSGNPENVGVVAADYKFGLGDSASGFIYAEYVYTDERMTDVNNDPLKLDGDYALFNLRGGVIFENLDLSVTAWGRNLTEEEYTSTIADGVAQDGKLNAYYSEPRTWGVTLRKNW